jgi:hypothetical protein
MSELNKVCREQAIPEITEEVDLPKSFAAVETKKLSAKEVRSLEEEKFRHEKHRDRWAYNYLLWCLLALMVIYGVETTLNLIFSRETLELTKSLFEVLKFLVSSLVGFLFAKRTL